ncbi:MAG: DHH family phosphoesterase [Promethearchaeia archaeon]
MINKKRFKKLINYLKSQRVLILTHNSADIDALSSVYLFSHIVNQLIKTKRLDIYFSSISRITKQYMNRFNSSFPEFNISFKRTVEPSNYDVAIILDTNNPDQIKGISLEHKSSQLDYIYIDHHVNLKQQTKRNKSEFNIIDDRYSSASEIIFEMVQSFQLDISLPLRFLTISGIIVDSGYFKFANNHTIHVCSQILNGEFALTEVYSMLEFDDDVSQKIARIKGLQRLELIRHGDLLFGLTHVGSFESLVATTMIKNGLDVAVVYSKREKSRYRITTRAKREICISKGLHLGILLNNLSNNYNANAGGHDGAASMNIEKINGEGIKHVLHEIIQQIKQILNKS